MTPQTRTYFNLARDPFTEPRSPLDVYDSYALQEVALALSGAVGAGKISALIGRMGSGKTLAIDRTLSALDGFHIVRIHTAERARCTGSHICHAILTDIAGRPVYGSLERRARAVTDALNDLHARGEQAILLLDDAHEVPTQTFRDLKRVHEICGSFQRPLSIVLSGQPTLLRRLQSEVPLREICARIETIEMPAIDAGKYLSWKIRRAGGDIGAIFEAGSIEAIASHPDSAAPLGAQRLAGECMDTAAAVCEQVSPEIVSHVIGEHHVATTREQRRVA